VDILSNPTTKNELCEDFKVAMGRSLGVSPNHIKVNDVLLGSIHFCFEVSNLSVSQKEALLTGGVRYLENQFPSAKEIKVSPLFSQMGFNINSIDHRGHKIYTEKRHSVTVGPPHSQRNYHLPSGWSRVGLSVIANQDQKTPGKFDSDDWLTPLGHHNNWYRAYHGTELQAFGSIYNNGFKISPFGTMGPGVYVSPHVEVAELYSKKISVNTDEGVKTYMCVFQLAVKPGSFSENNPTKIAYPDIYKDNPDYGDECSEWLVEDPQNVRPYAILCKEIKNEEVI
jgi:hypothetical protein